MRKIYYAHAICLYDGFDEQRHLSQIRRRFRRSGIVNPAERPDEVMRFYLKLIEGCDAVIFARLYGKITTGVGKEVNHALKIGKDVFELADGKFVKRTRRVKYVTRRETRRLYRKYRSS